MMASDMPNDPYMEQDLIDYFPTPFLQKYSGQIKSHHLHKEIIASRTTNSLVDRAGNTFVVEFMEKLESLPSILFVPTPLPMKCLIFVAYGLRLKLWIIKFLVLLKLTC